MGMSKQLNFYSLVTAPIEAICSKGNVVDTGTGFFYKRDEKWAYFVTNWHIVTGRSPLMAFPHKPPPTRVKLRVKLHKRIDGSYVSLRDKVILTMDINNELGNDPEWLEHPSYAYKVDLAVIRIPLDNLIAEANCNFISENGAFVKAYEPSPMDDVFVVGYPWGLTGGDQVLPLYKRGSVASEVIVDNAGLPKFLIDCRTAPSMSGSPVIAMHRGGLWAPSGKIDGETLMGAIDNFVGIYSGRLEAKKFEADIADSCKVTEIGVVWKKSALEDIIAAGVSGTKLGPL